jgi:hypothetical protein
LTGLSPVALMNFNELIQDGILIQNGSSRRREYLLKLNLKITEQKIKSLNHVRWNEENRINYIYLRLGLTTSSKEIHLYLQLILIPSLRNGLIIGL